MKVCSYPECENLCEGRTDFCGTHNRMMRKQSKGIRQIEVKEKSEQRELAAYVARKKQFIRGKECELKGVHFDCRGPIDIHHKRGRGELLMDTRYWMVVCRHHHGYITNHPEESYKNGWSELRLKNEEHLI